MNNGRKKPFSKTWNNDTSIDHRIEANEFQERAKLVTIVPFSRSRRPPISFVTEVRLLIALFNTTSTHHSHVTRTIVPVINWTRRIYRQYELVLTLILPGTIPPRYHYKLSRRIVTSKNEAQHTPTYFILDNILFAFRECKFLYI